MPGEQQQSDINNTLVEWTLHSPIGHVRAQMQAAVTLFVSAMPPPPPSVCSPQRVTAQGSIHLTRMPVQDVVFGAAIGPRERMLGSWTSDGSRPDSKARTTPQHFVAPPEPTLHALTRFTCRLAATTWHPTSDAPRQQRNIHVPLQGKNSARSTATT